MAVGDPCPVFVARSSNSPALKIDTIAGRWLVLTFIPGMADPRAAALAPALAGSSLFDDNHASLFLVTNDAQDEEAQRLPLRIPGVRAFWDYEDAVAGQFVARPGDLTTIVISPRLQIMAEIREPEPARHAQAVLDFLGAAPRVDSLPPMLAHAPVLVIPQVFEPEFCRMLIQGYETHGGRESGFMREIDGKTVEVKDRSHKVRSDWTIGDQQITRAIQARFTRRVVPEIKKSFQFEVTRMERYIVACYAAEEGGHFRAHRDNTTKGTAHRRFAVSVNLNADEYEGGDLRFPEFGRRTYRAPSGGAVVFSCSLLHEATPVTSGRRYAFLPFLYDEAAKKIREANLGFIQQNTAA
ncbi:2OG-Fe(II) oxygenase family protein [Geminicoccus roseus]|uniref:2OG-Fe(II) oxygenase family protein n=1 Tax=Geminicoccus roseus TaxID=404900 RepID=UPI0004202C29|nr:2OG-Fe(II) oxygenase [Geminicoccus roseus]